MTAAYTYDRGKAATAANFPLIGNPHRHFYETRNLPILMAVQHITAGLSDFDGPDSSIDATIRYSATTATVASYHGGVDADTIQDCLPDHYTAFAQGVKGHSFNSPALSLEIGLQAVDWRKAPAAWVDATIRNAARWWAPRVKRYSIPLRVMTDRDEIDRLIAARQPVGFVEHHVLDPANRSDAGYISATVTTFPWALLFTYIRAELVGAPIPEEDELMAVTVKNPITGELWDLDDALWSMWTYIIQTAAAADVDEAKIAATLVPLIAAPLKAAVVEAVQANTTATPEQIAEKVLAGLGAALTKES